MQVSLWDCEHSIRQSCINMINIRQNILLKNTFGLSKFSKSTPLLNSLGIKSNQQLYEEYKILFMRQIRRNSFTKEIFETLKLKYEKIQSPRESYIHILKHICIKYDFTIDTLDIKKTLKAIIENYNTKNDGLVDSIRFLIRNTGTNNFFNEEKMLLKLLLTVYF